jgi:hypothetical protein
MNKDNEIFAPSDRLLLVSIAKAIRHNTIYDATRYAWRVSRRRAENVDLVLGCVKGVVKGVFVPSTWLDASPGEATRKNFPGFVATHKGPRLGFVGKEANSDAQRRYLGKRVPHDLKIGPGPLRFFNA